MEQEEEEENETNMPPHMNLKTPPAGFQKIGNYRNYSNYWRILIIAGWHFLLF